MTGDEDTLKDYEILHIPSSQLPNIGLLHLTVSENRVGLRMTVLDALGRPDGIIIRRGIKANEGKLVVEAAEYDPDNFYDGVIPIDYERKKIGFHNKDFVDACKEMIRRYGGGEFTRGIYYTVKGVREGEEAIVFDFRVVASRTVKAAKPKKRSANGRIVGRRSNTSEKASGKSEQGKAERPYSTMAGQSQSLSGFSMPTMSRTF